MNQPVPSEIILPVELVEKIIDELATDKKALRACSYVSRPFYVRTRFHLFKTFNVYYPIAQHELTRLADFWDASPHIPQFVRTLYFSSVFLTERDAPRILRHLRNVTDAHMKDFFIHHFRYNEPLEALARLDIGTLTIKESHFTSFNAFAYVIRCFPRLYYLNLPSASIAAAADTEFPWVNNLKGCAPPPLKHLNCTARSVATRKSNTLLFANFPFHNEPFRLNDLKTLEVKCANQTDLVRLGRFLPHTLRTLKNLCIVKVDNGVSVPGPEHPLPWSPSIRPLALDSSERLVIEISLKVGSYADYLRWWAAGISEATRLRTVHVRMAMALMYLDQAEDESWRGAWRAFGEALEGKAWLEEVVVLLWVPSFPGMFVRRKEGVEVECGELVRRGVLRVVLPERTPLSAF
ncbi:hypothetical protein IW261DRAFT_1522610 [Armillaria novae-zelandiae]|uniref:Uncharacterized protein n=1 Tax=Armillaria novae-zelandiae TaxID=153914 RepID=A0AA39NHH6_9AGAR|nr:hypothetical protein IW261DRAFT_1522610 [Armillaria novae-zelandiae]